MLPELHGPATGPGLAHLFVLVLRWAPVIMAIALIPLRAMAQQETPGRTDAVRVFLDCDACDENFLRTEITFINYVRDRVGADVHVLITTQGTGGGGTAYTLKFIGLERFKGVDQTLVYNAPQTATSDERRRGVANTLKLGLIRYVSESTLASRLQITFEAPESATGTNVRDPWNFWVFRVGGSGSFEGEQSTREHTVSGSFSANRTTDNWRVNFNGNARYGEESFDLEEEQETFVSISRNIEGRALAVKSLGQHWSAGATLATQSSTFQNYRLRTRVAPGVEYNIYPYSESTHRLLTLFYSVGVQHFTYFEETIYGRTEETLFDHSLEVSLALRQPWGSAEASVETAQYLNRSGKYRVTAFGEMDVRLFKGFTFDMFGSVSRRRDQLSLRRGTASTEEILVRQRELATGYSYDIGFGLSYSFGSIYNNVVNPRFRNVGGF